MSADISKNPYFILSRSEQNHMICYSTYQRELNQLYLMISTALKAIISSQTSGLSKELAGDAYLALVKKTTQNLEKWQDKLPAKLRIAQEQDFQSDSVPGARAHALQLLSLCLVYNSILIILVYRPILSKQVGHLSTGPPSGRRNQLVPNAHDSNATSPG